MKAQLTIKSFFFVISFILFTSCDGMKIKKAEEVVIDFINAYSTKNIEKGFSLFSHISTLTKAKLLKLHDFLR